MGMPTKRSENADSRKLFPEDVYDLLVVAADERPAKGSGRDMAVIDFELAFDSLEKTITHYVPYMYESRDGGLAQSMFLDQLIGALCLDSDPEKLDPGELIGRRCRGELFWEKDEWPKGSGKFTTKERLRNLERHPDGPVFEGGTERVAQKQTAATAAVDDSDLPF